MIIDTLNEFADSADFANEPGVANVGDVIDLGPEVKRNIGNKSNMSIVIVVETAADGGTAGNATVQFQAVSDSSSAIDVAGSQSVHGITKAFSASELFQGKRITLNIQQGDDYERFFGLQIITAVEGEDDLVCSAFLTPFDQVTWETYADADN